MRIYGERLTLSVVFLPLVVALTLVGWSGSANQNASQQEVKKNETTPENDVPVLDLNQAETTGSDQLKGRKRRNSLRQDKKIAELPVTCDFRPAVWGV